MGAGYILEEVDAFPSFEEPVSAAYQSLFASGELARRAEAAMAALSSCTLCPRACAVDRLGGQVGFCRTGRLAQVASFDLHFGEEEPLVGESGSGTIFFAQCNLGCVFCQNWVLSQSGESFPEVTAAELAAMMVELQRRGAVNINFVTPSHVVVQILEALPLAVDLGLTVPLVYNSSGYDSVEALRLLDGVVDIYMPDAKFWSAAAAKNYCRAADYPEAAKRAIREMHRQVGDLALDERGLAVRGLLVRHLVMPGGLAGTPDWMAFLAALSPQTYVNVMDQYRPCHQAARFAELSSPATAAECEAARAEARRAGLTRLDERHRRLGRELWRLLMREAD